VTVLGTLTLGVQQFQVVGIRVDVEVEDQIGEAEGELFQDVLADDGFVAHGGRVAYGESQLSRQ